jgi:hypothetical protein
LGALLVGFALSACSGGGSGSSGGFRLVEFLESGQNNIPRNRQVTFRFSSPVMEDQDFSNRLRIQNVIQDAPANFARARGFYLVNGEEVVFTPRLPQLNDRSDAGFRADGKYHVFLSGGVDGLQSASGERVPNQQEFIFETNEYFEDIIPAEPPRSIEMLAVDPTDDSFTNISRLDPRPTELAQIDNATLIANGRIVDPGAGGPPEYDIPWNFELRISEPVDPATVDTKAVELLEVYSDAITTAPSTATPGHFGTAANYRVPIDVSVAQSVDIDGNYDIRIRVTPLQTLVDNTRYRLTISGDVLGLDFRKTFSGDNGLTGDGETVVDGAVFPEPGGLGYVTEFLVADRPGITSSKRLLFEPQFDGVSPELGQTQPDETKWNSALYDPASNPGKAVGFLSAFGQGVDGDLGISTDTTIDTGDTPNEPLGEPFTVIDLNPKDDYLGDTRPGGPLEYDSVMPVEYQLSSFTISTSATLTIIGVNPIIFRVSGITTINGTLDASGENGRNAGGSPAAGGAGGPGGFKGGDSNNGVSSQCLGVANSSCNNFKDYLDACSQSKAAFPTSFNGEGPGRGLAGGEHFVYPYDQKNIIGSSAGGGGSHGSKGQVGEDRPNAGQAPGTSGICDTQYTYNSVRLSGVIGVRGMPGPTYGDREIAVNTMGGSGGGAGGSHYTYYYSGTNTTGGAGGGGGGSVSIICAGAILVQGGIIDVSGGNGGKGRFFDAYKAVGGTGWDRTSGGGGGGAGGSLALISGANVLVTGGQLDASGGDGGPRGNDGLGTSCSACNKGGDGGKGYLFLMDADGEIEGFIPNEPGEYDNDPRGVLTISEFNADRFSSITAVTELFPVTAANPAYLPYDPSEDVKGLVSDGQKIRILVSSAQSDAVNPLLPDISTEISPFEVALIEYSNGATKVTVTGDMSDLNVTPGSPNREAFVRVQAKFDYTNSVEAALGPYALVDEVTISYEFNG